MRSSRSASRLTSILLSLFALIALAAFAGCGDDDDDSSDSDTTAAAVDLSDCTPDTLETTKDGVLTVGTDSPAFEPYFADDDPTNGQGFESAVAYAVADRLGFERSAVEWTVVPFNASYAPGPKDFDFDVNQISITPERAKQVDFSSPYYESKQGIVVLKDSDAADAASIDDLKGLNIGVQIGTTSLAAVEEVIEPDNDPQVFDTSNDVVTALKQGKVDAVVVDVPTGFFLTATEIPEATLSGQFAAPGGDQWGALLEKDSPLTDCVSAAIDDLRDSGELAEIEQEWISDKVNAPVLE
jgi:polar amino acid transport system substrate-binding protein